MVTVKEKTFNSLTSALCDAGVAVTFICVTAPGEASDWEARVSRQEMVCFVSRVTGDG